MILDIETIENLNRKGIYSITNILNNKKYIGSTAKSFKTRLQQHLNKLKCNKHHCRHLQNAWNKYGEKIFVFKIEELLENTSNIRYIEKQYIQKFDCINNGYNENPNPEKSPLLNNTFQNKVSKSLKLWWKKKKESLSPEDYKQFCMDKSSHIPWNKGIKLTKEQKKNFHSTKTITDKLKQQHIKNSKLVKDRSDYIEVYDINWNFLNRFWCTADLIEYSFSSENILPVKISNSHPKNLGKGLNASKIATAATTGVLYKGLHFKRVPKVKKLPYAKGLNSWKAFAEPIMSQAEDTSSEGAETTGEVQPS